MIEFERLPGNWREKAKQLSGATAADYIRWGGPKKIWVDDNCPMQISIVVVDEELRVYRIDDFIITNLVLLSSNLPPISAELHASTSESPPLN